jgi:cytochrome P450
MDALMALPYLDAVVRETLRVHSPLPSIDRVAMKDDVLPVEKPYTDKHGVVHNSIRYACVSLIGDIDILTFPNSVRKGDPIYISILAINRSQELWGPDAHEFKYVTFRLLSLPRSPACPTTDCRPERWQNIPDAVSQIPGAWGNILTFLGGTRACIGYRFSLVE